MRKKAETVALNDGTTRTTKRSKTRDQQVTEGYTNGICGRDKELMM